ncbi:ABC transporter ATP-binding protein [Enterococcus nangangensis]|uniref:ABC transporter ATP-binding protein n=1 Tax=Enterococcus nangangensis TaxID=2559926 RepID=UPI0010F56353|nr:ABC transporter ATP-binding protein [Enterococcus nangangensis]
MNLLELKNVSKNFGAKKVLTDVNLIIPQGSLYGFVGKNGAGKTTTMKLILGLEKLSGGTITVCGEEVRFGATKTNRFTGYLPDVPTFYGYLSAYEYLDLVGEIAGLNKTQRKIKINEMLAKVGLPNNRQKIKGYSRGMKQRLGIAQALLSEPPLLICDEPTSALDPSGRQEFLDLLASLKGSTTILFSTHILTDVERVCDHVAILNEGKIVVEDQLEALKERYAKPQLALTVAAAEIAALTAILQHLQQAGELTTFTWQEGTVYVTFDGTASRITQALMKELVAANVTPHRLEQVEPTLEQVFLEVTK